MTDAERHVRAVGCRDRTVVGAVRLDHPEGAVVHVRDAAAEWVRARVGDGLHGRQAPDRAATDVDGPQRAVQGEGDQPPVPCDGVAGDFAAARERRGVGEQCELARAEVQRPEARRGIVARAAAQEHHRFAVRGDREPLGHSQGESTRPYELCGERVHARHLAALASDPLRPAQICDVAHSNIFGNATRHAM
jgi:hypothetical protein